jgi:hypothetical protein
MTNLLAVKNALFAALLAPIAQVIGNCPIGPTPVPPATTTPPTITGAGVSGDLVQDQPGTVHVQATVTSSTGVASVIADLIRVGGSQTQPLSLTQNDLWSFVGTVTPPANGEQRVTITAADTAGLATQTTATVNVASSQPFREPPKITNPAATGTLTVNLAGSITVSATVIPINGTLASVIADLSEVNGFSDTPMILTTGNVWTISVVVVPTFSGTRTITIEAKDSFGDTSSATTTIVVSSGGTTMAG